jgi:hypothetical protein
LLTPFFGPEAELSAGERALTRRIQVVHDLAALCHLREQSRRGKPFNWNNVGETGNTIISNRDEDDWNKADKTANAYYSEPRWRKQQDHGAVTAFATLVATIVTKTVLRPVPLLSL